MKNFSEKDGFLNEKEEYETKLDSLNDEVLRLHEELAAITAEKDELEERNEEKQEEKDRSQANQLEELRCEVEYLQKELEVAKDEETAQTKQVVELTKIIKEQENEMIKLSERLQNEEADKNALEEMKKSLERMENDLQAILAEKEQLLSEKDNLNSAILKKDEELSMLRMKEATLEERNDSNAEFDELRQANSEMSEKIKRSEALIGNLRRVIDDLEEDSFTADTEKEKLQQQLEQGKILYTKLQDAFQSEKNTATALQAAKEELEKQIEELKENLTSKDETLKDLKSQENMANDTRIDALTSELETLKESMELQQKQSEEHIMAKQAELEDSQDQVQRLEDENENISKMLKKQRQQIKEWSDVLAAKQSEINALNEKLDWNQKSTEQDIDFESKVSELGELLAVEKKNAERLETKLQVLEKENEELKESLCEIQNENVSMKKTLESLHEKLKQENSKPSVEDVNEFVLKIEKLENNMKESQVQSDNLQSRLQEMAKQLDEKKSEVEKVETKRKQNELNMAKEITRLRNIIDEQQDEIDEAVRKNELLENQSKSTESIPDSVIKPKELQELQEQVQHLQQSLQAKTKQCDEQSVKLEETEKKRKEGRVAMGNEITRLRDIIDQQQDEIDVAVKKNQHLENQNKANENLLTETKTEVDRLKALDHIDQIEALRIELANKNMKIQELEYRSFKTNEETEKLRQEIQFGYSKMSMLKERLRKMQEDDTIPIKRRKPSTDSDAGVVSSVAVYSLKAKLEQLEKENHQLKDDKAQLEKEKVTLSLFKTEASNQASKLTDEVQFLRNQVKELSRQKRSKEKEERPANVLGPSNQAEAAAASCTSQKEPSLADRRRTLMTQERENKPAYSGWLSPSKTRNMFKDKPNQCPHQ